MPKHVSLGRSCLSKLIMRMPAFTYRRWLRERSLPVSCTCLVEQIFIVKGIPEEMRVGKSRKRKISIRCMIVRVGIRWEKVGIHSRQIEQTGVCVCGGGILLLDLNSLPQPRESACVNHHGKNILRKMKVGEE